MFVFKVVMFGISVFSVVLVMVCCKISDTEKTPAEEVRDFQDQAACIAKHNRRTNACV